MRPLAIDLFCGAGGASAGLVRAGFDVVGVDLSPQPRYPFRFVQADATEPPVDLSRAAFVWASPPCQRWTRLAQKAGTAESHPEHIDRTRRILTESGRPWAIENVELAPLRRDLVLTGDMFGLRTYRKRRFELSFFLLAPPPGRAFGPKTRAGAVTVAGHAGGSSRRDGWTNGTVADWREAMGIDWMTAEELAEAVPPAYAEFIGRAALALL